MARPNLSYLKNLILVLVGIPCGFLTGLSGIGNTSVVSAGVGFLLGVRDSRNSGAALLTTVASVLACLIAYSQHNACPWILALLVTIGQIIGASFGQILKGTSPAVVLRPILAIAIMALGLYMMVSRTHVHSMLFVDGWRLLLCGLGVGIFTGFVTGILESGGLLTVPAALYLLGLPILKAQGLSILVLLLASLPAALAYLGVKAVEVRSASWVPFGALFGALAGAYYATSRFAPSALIDFDGLIITLIALYHLLNRPHTPPKASVDSILRSE